MTLIILLILTGILLIILEILVIPGITVAGLSGLGLMVGGVYISYNKFGSITGNWVLFSTLLMTVLLVLWALRSKTWKRLSLNTEISNNVETFAEDAIKVGDKGSTITRLNPMGKVRVNDIEVEARCPDNFVDPQVEIEVTKVTKTYIFVKPI